MSAKHWSSAKESNVHISKLFENHVFEIIDVQKIQTPFGKKYIVIDNENERFWTNTKLESFIKEHEDVKKFTLTTSCTKSFINKKGQKIEYLDIEIDYN